jgi:PhzF family phenazine biosynthesis protein
MRSRAFRQVDVFTAVPYLGNPVAVVLEGDGLSDAEMAAFARWTNLSETTFVLPPQDPAADYRLRIFTPSGELPFAGHPTLGSCHAWLNSGATAKGGAVIVQECGVGLVELRRDGARLAFAAPARLREGPLDDAHVDRIARGLGIDRAAILGHARVDNGPGWCAVRLASAADVLAVRADWAVLGDTKLGVVGAYGADAGADAPAFEVRAFFPAAADADGRVPGGFEDPVTGSLNASLAQWLREEDLAPAAYVASQGTAVQRAGRVHVRDDGERIWVGGDCAVCIAGVVAL